MNRRSFLKLSMLTALGAMSTACSLKKAPSVRIAAHTWPGYEFIYLARSLGILDPELVKLIETPNATTNIRALGAEMAEGAMLTLDEVITAREGGIDLSIVTILNVSMGADALLVRPNIRHLSEIRGLRIGVEHTATGAVMLDAALKAAGLQATDIQLVYLSIDEHKEAFENGSIDAVVTYEPVKTLLINQGMKSIFSSRETPGNIIDVLAFRSDILESHEIAIQHAVDSHFIALASWKENPEIHSAYLSRQLGVKETELMSLYDDLELPDKSYNTSWLVGSQAKLLQSAQNLGIIMLDSGLLSRTPKFDRLFDSRFII